MPRGQVLLGEGYWRRPPDPDYLKALGDADEGELASYGGCSRRRRTPASCPCGPAWRASATGTATSGRW